tara:strand:- start:1178 stop:1291 length:114 start_codon:yes stop_codon:yes gene_type:complete
MSRSKNKDIADSKGRIKFSDLKKKGKHKRAKAKSNNR